MTETQTEIRTELVWSPDAWDTFSAIKNHCHKLRAYFGDRVAEHHQANLFRCIGDLMAAGPTNVYKDDMLSLLFVARITIGMIWTPDSDQKMKQCLATFGFHYDAYEPQPDWPRTGEWSLHS